MKRIALVLSFAFLLFIPTISEAANPVAGGKCSKAGTTQIFQNKKFTCIKSGKKLIWSKGQLTLKSEIKISDLNLVKRYVHQDQEFSFDVSIQSAFAVSKADARLEIKSRNSKLTLLGTLQSGTRLDGAWHFSGIIPNSFIAGENDLILEVTDTTGASTNLDIGKIDVRLAIPKEIPTNSTTTITSTSDKLSYKNKMIYHLGAGLLSRKADGGSFFETDSRGTSDFSAIRFNAYKAVNPADPPTTHSNVEFTFVVRPSFPAEMVEHSKKQLEEAANFWSQYFPKKIPVTVYLVTEKDRDFISSNNWLNKNLPQIFDRFDTHNERPFISGGGRYWATDGVWSAKIFLATASYVDLDNINYEWPQVAKHEFMHVVQEVFYSRNGRFGAESDEAYANVLPLHFMEGSANTVSYLTAFRNLGWSNDAMDWLVWIRANNASGWIKVKTEADAIAMMKATEKTTPESAFEMSYAIGALMYEWVLGTYGFEGYLKILNELADSPSFDETLKRAIGLNKEEFYKAVAPYITKIFTSL